MPPDRALYKLCIVIGLSSIAACSSTSKVISSDKYHIAVVPPKKVLYEVDRPAAAAPVAQAHCQKYGKSAVLQDTKMTEGQTPKVVSVYFECAPQPKQ
jgi:hypothetical protein